MKNKKTLTHKKVRRANRQRRKILTLGVVGLLTVLSVATIGSPWGALPGTRRFGRWMNPASAPNPVPPPNNPSREYIYAGGRLIATEAPASASGSTLAPTNGLAATTRSDLLPANVTITWEATAGAHHYEVERTTNIGTLYETINNNVTGTTFTDTSPLSVNAYLYRVRAVDAAGNMSPYSSSDLATAISFTDDTLYAQSTLVRAAHINELRQAIDAVRRLVNAGDVNWGGGIQPNVTEVQATHIQDMRVNLDAARSLLNLPQCSYTDNSLAALRASLIRKEHIEQLRTCVR